MTEPAIKIEFFKNCGLNANERKIIENASWFSTKIKKIAHGQERSSGNPVCITRIGISDAFIRQTKKGPSITAIFSKVFYTTPDEPEKEKSYCVTLMPDASMLAFAFYAAGEEIAAGCPLPANQVWVSIAEQPRVVGLDVTQEFVARQQQPTETPRHTALRAAEEELGVRNFKLFSDFVRAKTGKNIGELLKRFQLSYPHVATDEVRHGYVVALEVTKRELDMLRRKTKRLKGAGVDTGDQDIMPSLVRFDKFYAHALRRGGHDVVTASAAHLAHRLWIEMPTCQQSRRLEFN